MDEQLINDFERQLEESYKSKLKLNVTFLVNKERDICTAERYDCWGIASKLGSEKFNNWRKVAEQALTNIRKLYPNKEIRI